MITLKWIHVAAVILSAGGFAARGLWSLRQPHWRAHRWARTLPHLVDTVLLASGVAMALLYRWSPFAQPWLLTKLLFLLVYILLGMVALRWARTAPLRITAGLLALITFGYIVAVALTKDPAVGCCA